MPPFRKITALASAVVLAGAGAGLAVSATASAATTSCHARDLGKLPDARCTPGAGWYKVTQATIGKTICKSGWTATVRPPVSYTDALKVTQIREYHYRNTNVHAYEEDHLIPLELGGSPTSVKNLWPEYDGGHIPNPKDAVENYLKRAVCAHKVSLSAARHAIAVNWITAEHVLGLK
jgi:hypothetical protein